MEAVDLVKSFRADGVERPVLRGLSIAADRGGWIAVMGPSGCGKSTMLHLLGGLDLPDRGSISISGEEITALSAAERAVLRRKRVGYVFQQYNLLPHLDVTANVELPQRLAGVARRTANDRTRELLDSLGLSERRRDLPGRLSGGEQQRVAIARALVMEPTLLLADEPTGDLDEHTADTLHELLREMHRERGLTSLIATHNPRLAAACDRVLRLVEGKLVRER